MRVKQILLNLVNNAIKFTEHGAVALDLARGPGGTTQLRVSDSGPGIAESTRARLFQRFEQADGARSATVAADSGWQSAANLSPACAATSPSTASRGEAARFA